MRVDIGRSENVHQYSTNVLLTDQVSKDEHDCSNFYVHITLNKRNLDFSCHTGDGHEREVYSILSDFCVTFTFIMKYW